MDVTSWNQQTLKGSGKENIILCNILKKQIQQQLFSLSTQISDNKLITVRLIMNCTMNIQKTK